jgi:putative ABC transport system substrate-binding protein
MPSPELGVVAMKRRDFITLVGGAAAAWPMVARAQQAAMPVVGFLGSSFPEPYADRVAAIRQGLRDTGFVDGQNLTIEYRWADGQYDRLPTLVADLVRRQVSVIVTSGGPGTALAAKAASSTIPIVFAIGSDPVKYGLIASLNRPGANVTGLSSFSAVLGAKRLELLRELVPKAAVFVLLNNPDNADAETQSMEVKEAISCTPVANMTSRRPSRRLFN